MLLAIRSYQVRLHLYRRIFSFLLPDIKLSYYLYLKYYPTRQLHELFEDLQYVDEKDSL
jgi:hypothetical protein